MDSVNLIISHCIKTQVQSELSKYDLTINEYMEMVLTDVANNGLPEYFVNPSPELTISILEANEVISNQKDTPNITTTREELNRMLNS